MGLGSEPGRRAHAMELHRAQWKVGASRSAAAICDWPNGAVPSGRMARLA